MSYMSYMSYTRYIVTWGTASRKRVARGAYVTYVTM